MWIAEEDMTMEEERRGHNNRTTTEFMVLPSMVFPAGSSEKPNGISQEYIRSETGAITSITCS